jgi:hypothetical protein
LVLAREKGDSGSVPHANTAARLSTSQGGRRLVRERGAGEKGIKLFPVPPPPLCHHVKLGLLLLHNCNLFVELQLSNSNSEAKTLGIPLVLGHQFLRREERRFRLN